MREWALSNPTSPCARFVPQRARERYNTSQSRALEAPVLIRFAVARCSPSCLWKNFESEGRRFDPCQAHQLFDGYVGWACSSETRPTETLRNASPDMTRAPSRPARSPLVLGSLVSRLLHGSNAARLYCYCRFGWTRAPRGHSNVEAAGGGGIERGTAECGVAYASAHNVEGTAERERTPAVFSFRSLKVGFTPSWLQLGVPCSSRTSPVSIAAKRAARFIEASMRFIGIAAPPRSAHPES